MNSLSQFINETGYITDAEKHVWCFVFHLFVNKKKNKRHSRFTKANALVDGRSRCFDGSTPKGRDFSSIANRLNGLVIHVSWNDAQPIVNGLENVFRQKQNGNMPLLAGLLIVNTLGGSSYPQT